MISSDSGIVVIKGDEPLVMAEMTSLLKAFKRALEDNNCKGLAEEKYKTVLEKALETDEQIEAEAAKLKKQIIETLDRIDNLKKILKGLGE